MKRWGAWFFQLTAVLAFTATIAQGQGSAADSAAEQGIRAAIDHYFRGHAGADSAQMRMAFLPTAHIEGIREGRFTSWTAAEYASRFKGTPAADEPARTRKIDLIDVSGDAAMVKATLVHGPTTFTDYFVMLKVDGEWKIANKVYHAARTAPPPK